MPTGASHRLCAQPDFADQYSLKRWLATSGKRACEICDHKYVFTKGQYLTKSIERSRLTFSVFRSHTLIHTVRGRHETGCQTRMPNTLPDLPSLPSVKRLAHHASYGQHVLTALSSMGRRHSVSSRHTWY